MEKHISIEEMQEVIYYERSKKNTGDFFKDNKEWVEKISKVQAHIVACPECLETYRTIGEIDDLVKGSSAVKDKLENFNLADAIRKIPNNTLRVRLFLHYAEKLLTERSLVQEITDGATLEEKEMILKKMDELIENRKSISPEQKLYNAIFGENPEGDECADDDGDRV